jgi:FixJ family two-component response regulator
LVADPLASAPFADRCLRIAVNDDVLEADGFDDREERTSPEFVKAGAHRGVDPMVVVCTPDGTRRRTLVSLLSENGWNAVELKTTEELLETSRALNPEVIIVDSALRLSTGASIPEVLRQRRPDAIRRIMALVPSGVPQEVAGAVVDGYDDFIVDADNPVEVLARTTANLRACRTLQEMERQKRDAASLLELSQTLASSLDLQLILHMVSRLISEVVGMERCSIVILDPEHNDAVMVAASEDRKVKDLRINLQKYPELQRCVQAAAPIVITDADRDPLLATARGSASSTRCA